MQYTTKQFLIENFDNNYSKLNKYLKKSNIYYN